MSLEGNAEKNTLLQKLSGKIRYVPELDETLTHPDKAANAKAVGDAIARVEGKADMMVPNVSKNVTFNGAKSGLEAMNVQDAIDEVKGITDDLGNKKNATILYSGALNSVANIDTAPYEFVYYEFIRSTGLCLCNGIVPVSILTSEAKEYNHTEYVNSSYNAEMTAQLSKTTAKGYTKAMSGWDVQTFNVYGI